MKKIADLKNIDCYVLDMDGTLYLDDEWIEGASDFLAALRASGKEFVFLTNNSSKDARAYAGKLGSLGFPVEESRIVTSGAATIACLKEEFSGKRVFLLGNDVLKAEFQRASIVLDEEKPEVVVVGFDTTLDYVKMQKTCDFVRAGLPYIATHPDLNCPTKSGFMPDAGAIIAFIQASTGRSPDIVVGKPHQRIMEYLLGRLRTPKERVAVVGDRLYTDIRAGALCGLATILVLSGEATLADVDDSDVKPDYVLPSVAKLIEVL